jgi:hypothetical protein
MISSFGKYLNIEILFLLFSLNFGINLYLVIIEAIKLIIFIVSLLKLISLYYFNKEKKNEKNTISDENEKKSLLEKGNLIIKCVICHENIDVFDQLNYVRLKCHIS